MKVKKLLKVNKVVQQLTKDDVLRMTTIAIEIGTLKERAHDITPFGPSAFYQIIVDADMDDQCKSIEYLIDNTLMHEWCKRELSKELRWQCETIVALRQARDKFVVDVVVNAR